jgi:SAM-dependent methyltransferase
VAADHDESAADWAPRFDTSVAHIARIYDFWLGGKDNFAVDRAAAEMALEADPQRAWSVRSNRAFLARAVQFLAGEVGIRQFLDIGTGLPAANNTHQVAQSVAPDARIVYVDNDPIVLSHAKALLKSSPEGACAYIDADLRDTGRILAKAAETLDFSRPVAIMLIAVLHCVQDQDEPHRIVAELLDAVPSGSYLTLSHPSNDLGGPQRNAVRAQLNELMGAPMTGRNREQVTSFFTGLEVLDPGVVVVSEWRPASEIEAKMPAFLWGGVGRKKELPASPALLCNNRKIIPNGSWFLSRAMLLMIREGADRRRALNGQFQQTRQEPCCIEGLDRCCSVTHCLVAPFA